MLPEVPGIYGDKNDLGEGAGVAYAAATTACPRKVFATYGGDPDDGDDGPESCHRRALGVPGCRGSRGDAQGAGAKVRRGPYTGDSLSVDRIIPVKVVPELDKVIANLELMPLRMNEGKSVGVGARQLLRAEKLHRAGLLNAAGLRAVKGAAVPTMNGK